MKTRAKHRARRMRQVTLQFPSVTEGDPHYALEKFAQAVEVLGSRRGAVADRLRQVYLELHSVAATDVPVELRSEFERLRADLAALGLDAKPDLSAAKESGGRRDLSILAKQICSLEQRLRAASAAR